MQEEKGLADEETRERDGLYERAERLVSALASIQDTLKEAVDDVNTGTSVGQVMCDVLASFQLIGVMSPVYQYPGCMQLPVYGSSAIHSPAAILLLTLM